jgi:ligand-binding SRPBCC domain-containing protein
MQAHQMELNNSTWIRMAREDAYFIVETRLSLPGSIETIFSFFADAGNLGILTPPWLRFKILTPRPITMRPGAEIEYRIYLHGIPMRWQSEITVWEPPLRFVDEQRRGPYRRWIHEHVFRDCGNGVEIRDFVRYSVLGGRLVNFLFVQRDVRNIFLYRTQKLKEIFIQ